MLGRRNQHALLHQAGGIADAGHVAADGFDFKSIQISAAEDDACARRRRQNAHGDGRAAVQANATARNRRADCLLVNQTWVSTVVLITFRLPRDPGNWLWQKSHTPWYRRFTIYLIY